MVNIKDMQCGKMSVETSPQIKEKTSKLSSRNSIRSRTRKLISLNMINGNMQEKCWEITTQLPVESLMRNIGEYPSEENESFLSQILMEEEHPKYYLSQRACEGILRRAKQRSKELPEILQKVLKKQAMSA